MVGMKTMMATRNVPTLALLILLCAALAPAAQEARPIGLHPENPHYFLWRGEPTILITSGEHYGALLNLDFDYVRYFDALESDGLNHTRTFSGFYREIPSSFRITDNTLAPKPGRYICPWARGDQAGYVGHVYHQIGAYLVGDVAETGPVHDLRVGGEAGDDHFWFVFQRQGFHLVVVHLAGVGVQTVLHRVVQLAGKVGLGTVSQVATVCQAHAQNGVTGVAQGQKDR